MNLSETAKILAKAQLIDNRHVDRETIQAWHEIIGHHDYQDAMTALTIHRQESTEYLTPAHINQNIRRAREIRATEQNRQRALTAAPPAPRNPPPAWFREAINNLGKDRDAS